MTDYSYGSLGLALNGIDTAIENLAHFMEYYERTKKCEVAIQDLRRVRLYVKEELKKALKRRESTDAKD